MKMKVGRMTKNENGNSLGCVCGCSCDAISANSRPQTASPGGGATIHSGCGGRGDCLDSKPLSYVYAPDQQFRLLYSAKDALTHGTLFEELYKPMEVYGRE